MVRRKESRKRSHGTGYGLIEALCVSLTVPLALRCPRGEMRVQEEDLTLGCRER